MPERTKRTPHRLLYRPQPLRLSPLSLLLCLLLFLLPSRLLCPPLLLLLPPLLLLSTPTGLPLPHRLLSLSFPLPKRLHRSPLPHGAICPSLLSPLPLLFPCQFRLRRCRHRRLRRSLLFCHHLFIFPLPLL